MSALKINGYPINVLDVRPRQSNVRKGSTSRSIRGRTRDDQRGIRRSFNITAKFEDFAEAEALQGMLCGEGHLFNFTDGLAARTGLHPFNARWSELQVLPDLDLRPDADRGPGALYCADLDQTVLAINPQFRDKWTVLVELTAAEASPATIYATRDDGVAYAAGARDDDVLAEFSASTDVVVKQRNGIVYFTSTAGAEGWLGDIRLLPYRCTDAMLEVFTGDDAPRWGDLPRLRFEGDFIADPTGVCVCDLRPSSFLGKYPDDPAGTADTWRKSAQTFSFVLHEVEPIYRQDSFAVVEAVDDAVTLPAGLVAGYEATDPNGNGDGASGWSNGDQTLTSQRWEPLAATTIANAGLFNVPTDDPFEWIADAGDGLPTFRSTSAATSRIRADDTTNSDWNFLSADIAPYSMHCLCKPDAASGNNLMVPMGTSTTNSGTTGSTFYMDNRAGTRVAHGLHYPFESVSAAGTYTLGDWHLMSLEYDGAGITGGLRLYINGTLVDTDNTSGTYSPAANSTLILLLGNINWSRGFDGDIRGWWGFDVSGTTADMWTYVQANLL